MKRRTHRGGQEGASPERWEPASRPARASQPAGRPDPERPETANNVLSSKQLFWFRAAFACGVVSDSISMISSGEMMDFFGHPKRVNFTYRLAPFVSPLSGRFMSMLPAVTAASAILFGSGMAPRTGLSVFCMSSLYLFLCDAARFVNHHYLYIIFGFLLLLAESDTDGDPYPSRAWSPASKARRWHLWLLRFQCSVMYLYGALTKCTTDYVWRREPLRSFVAGALADGGRLHGMRMEFLLDETALATGAAFALMFDLVAAGALWHHHGRYMIMSVPHSFARKVRCPSAPSHSIPLHPTPPQVRRHEHSSPFPLGQLAALLHHRLFPFCRAGLLAALLGPSAAD